MQRTWQLFVCLLACLPAWWWLGMLLLGGNASRVVSRLCEALQLKSFIEKAYRGDLYHPALF